MCILQLKIELEADIRFIINFMPRGLSKEFEVVGSAVEDSRLEGCEGGLEKSLRYLMRKFDTAEVVMGEEEFYYY